MGEGNKAQTNHKRDPKALRHLYFSRKTAHFLLFVPENKIKGWAVAEINKVAESLLGGIISTIIIPAFRLNLALALIGEREARKGGIMVEI
jgi:hypothetical protein